MTNTGVPAWDKTVHASREWIEDVRSEIGWKDPQKLHLLTKAVLQTLRERLPIDEAAHLGAEMPALLRGYYYEDYRPGSGPLKFKTEEEFYQLVQEKTSNQPVPAEEVTQAVLRVLKRRTSEGQFQDIRTVLPERLQGMVA